MGFLEEIICARKIGSTVWSLVKFVQLISCSLLCYALSTFLVVPHWVCLWNWSSRKVIESLVELNGHFSQAIPMVICPGKYYRIAIPMIICKEHTIVRGFKSPLGLRQCDQIWWNFATLKILPKLQKSVINFWGFI